MFWFESLLKTSRICNRCETDAETMYHLICLCPTLAKRRLRILRGYVLNLVEIRQVSYLHQQWIFQPHYFQKQTRLWFRTAMDNPRPFKLFSVAFLNPLKYHYFIEKSTKSIGKVSFLALDMTVQLKFGPRTDLGCPWLIQKPYLIQDRGLLVVYNKSSNTKVPI